MTTRTVVVAFVDMAGYTALTEAHGDDDAAACAKRFYELAARGLTGDTRIVKRIGDAVMLVGSDIADTVASTLRLFADSEKIEGFPGLRAGLHAGPAVELDGDYFGATVNVAARIGAHARTGEILCGSSVASALAGSHQARVVPLGSVRFKNVEHPVEVFAILSVAPLASGPIDPVCRMQVARPFVTIPHRGHVYVFCSDACAGRFRASPDAFTLHER
jgi:class 3 adenylate cyclase/YHS domain-containing protein